MKLASLPQRRDGRLVVVSTDQAWYADADHIVPTLQAALDDWDRQAPLLDTLFTELEHAAIPRRRFHEREACAPLPRAFRRTADGEDRPGDDLASGRSDVAEAGIASSIELCVVTGEVPHGAGPAEARAAVRLVGLVHDLGAGALSPLLATPEFLEREGLVLHVERGGKVAANNDVAPVDFGALVAELAADRRLGPGTIVGSAPLAQLPPLAEGETIRIELRDARGKSLLGAIERTVRA
ncbi:FAA hydrolase family protein [Novosphingobium flavum]|uniref:FAA hydrolase family protein n=1 Tax=Novosphingobium flavum TaxID=1778672 RepID=A0A7X1FNB2_9SPHN|nr:FAA hydrolase family protein [Novosphingobium flavum]MBC2663921.1 FAA hydrolase family protein [Novosphingobium flavum]